MIDISHLSRRFGTFQALDDVSLRIRPGKLVALLGPSGSGKTTLLRILAGLEHGDGGKVELYGQESRSVSSRDRRVGFVFQHYALFRHMNVAANVGFGLNVRRGKGKLSKDEIAARVRRLLDLVHLSGLAHRYPQQLSGGQRQRVALARALAVEPRLLLLDEPFGALDAQVRKDLRRWLRRLHDELGLTSVFVTHDQEEALDLADEVVIMNKGRIEQIGAPADIYDSPATPFVFQFLGNANRLDGTIHSGIAHIAHWRTEAGGRANGAVSAFIRPHDIHIPARGQDGEILRLAVLGPNLRLDLRLADGRDLEAIVERESVSHLHLNPGIGVALSARRIGLFSP